jgi:hypothetical protein
LTDRQSKNMKEEGIIHITTEDAQEEHLRKLHSYISDRWPEREIIVSGDGISVGKVDAFDKFANEVAERIIQSEEFHDALAEKVVEKTEEAGKTEESGSNEGLFRFSELGPPRR